MDTASHASSDAVRWSAYGGLAPAFAVLFLLLALPLAATVYLSLSPNVLLPFNGPALDNFRYLFGKTYYVDVLARTMRISFVVTLIALLIGYPAAGVLKGLSERLGSTLIVGLTFPILTGPLVVVLGWMILLSDGGPLLGPLVRAGWIDPLRLLGSETAIVIGLVHFTLPFVILTLLSSLRQIPNDLIEAAQSLGADPLRMFLRVVWPLSLPGVISASIIAFSLAASAYVSPHYLGGATQLTLTTLVAQFILATFNSEMAAACAVVLLVLMAVIIFAFTKLTARFLR
jgi:ABC-type spermidine/putrescine transport system permease subunit I